VTGVVLAGKFHAICRRTFQLLCQQNTKLSLADIRKSVTGREALIIEVVCWWTFD
jgi:hypothetical protein